MIDGKNVQYVNKSINTFPELVKVLSHFCCNPDPDDQISFEASVLLGRLCVSDENARFKLKQSLEFSNDTHVKAKSLEILVKQLNVTDNDIVQSTFKMLSKSSVWKHRCLAAELLITLGQIHVFAETKEEDVYTILERRLWDDPTVDVRLSSAKALAALGMFSKACEKTEKNLEDPDEDTRSQAVISVGTLGMKNERIIRILLEMLELDSSDYVRLMVVRTFVTLKLIDKRVMRALRERERAEGPLSRESKKAIKALESLVSLGSPVLGRKSYTPSRRAGSSQGQNRLVQNLEKHQGQKQHHHTGTDSAARNQEHQIKSKNRKEVMTELIGNTENDQATENTCGSCMGNPGPCGAGAIIYTEDSRPAIRLHRPVAQRGSILLAELVAIVMVLEFCILERLHNTITTLKIFSYSRRNWAPKSYIDVIIIGQHIEDLRSKGLEICILRTPGQGNDEAK
ncbi:unnamed protein product [Mytilus edulis]|nr:unnamed protein product [Mytilus edulis]